jgi:hypothetical protein
VKLPTDISLYGWSFCVRPTAGSCPALCLTRTSTAGEVYDVKTDRHITTSFPEHIRCKQMNNQRSAVAEHSAKMKHNTNSMEQKPYSIYKYTFPASSRKLSKYPHNFNCEGYKLTIPGFISPPPPSRNPPLNHFHPTITYLSYIRGQKTTKKKEPIETCLPSSLALKTGLLKSFFTPIFRNTWSPEHRPSLLFTNRTVTPY